MLLPILLIAMMHIQTVYSQNNSLQFLVEGINIKYTTRAKLIDLGLLIRIDFSAKQITDLMSSFDTHILGFYTNYPAFANDRTFGDKYIELISTGSTNSIKAAELLLQAVKFKGTAAKPTTSTCDYSHQFISNAIITTQINGLLSAKAKIGSTWTKDEILNDPGKDQAIRTFALAINEMTELFEEAASRFINTLDLLANKIVPEDVRGIYKNADCVNDDIVEEHIAVKRCLKTTSGYYCHLELIEPTNTIDAIHMYPVHYHDVRISPRQSEEVFIKTPSTGKIQSLHCENYMFSTDHIPVCEKKELNSDCAEALKLKQIESSIRYCHFSRSPETQIILKTIDDALLIQGTDVHTERKVGDKFIPVSSDTPILVYSPDEVLVKQNGEEWLIEPTKTDTNFNIVQSSLSNNQLIALKARMWWIELLEFLKAETVTQIALVFIAIIGLPLTIGGLVISLKNSSKIRNTLALLKGNGKGRKKTKKDKYKDNAVALQRLYNQE